MYFDETSNYKMDCAEKLLNLPALEKMGAPSKIKTFKIISLQKFGDTYSLHIRLNGDCFRVMDNGCHCAKCPYSELFWSTFSRIRIDYGEILRMSQYSIQMRENGDQNNFKYGHFLSSVYMWVGWH